MFKTVKSLAARWISNRRARRRGQKLSQYEKYRLEQEALEERRRGFRKADRERIAFLDCKRLGELDLMYGAAAEGDVAQLRDVMRTLVVVDMQAHWLKGYSEREKQLLVDAVAEQITQARALEWPIIFLEFLPTSSYGDTLPELYKLVDGYEPHYRKVGKYYRSGAGDVLRACEQAGFDSSAFQVCGIFADQCVCDTVRDIALNRTDSIVCVVPTACRSYKQVNGVDNEYDWTQFPNCENIDLVPAPGAYTGHGYVLSRTQPSAANPEHLAPSAPQLVCP